MPSADFLTVMADSSQDRAEMARLRESELRARTDAMSPPLRLSMTEGRFEVIAEAKLRSPSAGRLATTGLDTLAVTRLARSYQNGGAVAVSVLTEPERFDGHLGHLEAAAGVLSIPVLRKDFLVDPVQVYEARALGASGVLLIARILQPGVLAEMVDLAAELGMFSLVEVFNEADLELASTVFDREILIGANCRNLSDLSVDPSRFRSLAPLLPAHLPWVAESGLNSPTDMELPARLGYGLALVGSSLSSAPDPEAAVVEYLAAGRRAGLEAVS